MPVAIYVCDAIMGSGKSESAITYMSEHPEKRFVYITPYLDEVQRIKDGCPALNMMEPSDKLPEFHWSKLEHTRKLLEDGANLATTHAAFRSYTHDIVENIRKWGYTLLVDEAVNVFCEANYSINDIQVLLDGGYIQQSGDIGYTVTDKHYDGGRLDDIFQMASCNNLIPVNGTSHGVQQLYFWAMPKEVLTAFDDVFVMTYLFDDCEMKYFLDMNGLEYQNIGIRYEGGVYRFTEGVGYVPGYVLDLRDRVHVFDNPRLNGVGDNRWALSSNWYRRGTGPQILKNNLYNYIRNYMGAKSDDVLWSTFNGRVSALRGRGFSKQHDVFNLRATNKYRSRHVLAYCVNVFASPDKVKFFQDHGIVYNEDAYALSIMVQWIWRSAIRDGDEIYIYIPSRRMRELLLDWMDRLAEGVAR